MKEREVPVPEKQPLLRPVDGTRLEPAMNRAWRLSERVFGAMKKTIFRSRSRIGLAGARLDRGKLMDSSVLNEPAPSGQIKR